MTNNKRQRQGFVFSKISAWKSARRLDWEIKVEQSFILLLIKDEGWVIKNDTRNCWVCTYMGCNLLIDEMILWNREPWWIHDSALLEIKVKFIRFGRHQYDLSDFFSRFHYALNSVFNTIEIVHLYQVIV